MAMNSTNRIVRNVVMPMVWIMSTGQKTSSRNTNARHNPLISTTWPLDCSIFLMTVLASESSASSDLTLENRNSE